MKHRFTERFARMVLVVTCATLFAGLGHVGVRHLVGRQNRTFLGELTDTALRYVEVAAASADQLLADIARQMPANCTGEALQGIRLHVYEHSLIKDVRLATREGMVRCSAFPETLEFDRDWPSREMMLATPQAGSRMFRVEQFTSDALGVYRETGLTTALVAIVAVDPLQLDALPAPLRGHGQVTLTLANGDAVATSGPDPAGADVTTVGRGSARYPFRITVRVEAPALAQWNTVPTAPILAGAGMLGALFGLLLGRMIGRPLDPAAALDLALAAGEFRPYYQPFFNLGDRRIIGCEVLMRWVLADGKVLPPSAFIPLAESTGRIEAMTWQVLGRALQELKRTFVDDPGFKAAFNIVPRHLLTADFQATLERHVTAASVRPDQIILELTERDEFDDLERAQSVIQNLKTNGFKFALDDVGVGHSGLSHIQGLAPDKLKIDKFFVDALTIDGAAKAVIDMLVRLAGELGMGIMAEGVETEGQVEALRACGVQQGQGYIVSPPVPLAALLPMIARAEERAWRSALTDSADDLSADLAAGILGRVPVNVPLAAQEVGGLRLRDHCAA